MLRKSQSSCILSWHVGCHPSKLCSQHSCSTVSPASISTYLPSAPQVCWAGPHTLALAGRQDTAVRMLQLDTDDNYLLDLKSKDGVSSSSNRSRPASAAADTAGIVGLVYEPGQQVLAAATAGGQVCLFKHWLSKAHAAAAASAAAADPASQWEPSHSFQASRAPPPCCFTVCRAKPNAPSLQRRCGRKPLLTSQSSGQVLRQMQQLPGAPPL